MKPKRIQLRRVKGWKMPENTVSVARPGIFGNPFTIEGCRDAGYKETDREIAARCVGAFKGWLGPYWRNNWDREESETARSKLLDGLPKLRGKNLACFCKLCERHKDGKPLGEECPDCAPCHADEILVLANAE